MQMAATLDLFPTIMKVTNISMPTDRIFDGVDMSAILFDNKPVKAYMYVILVTKPVE